VVDIDEARFTHLPGCAGRSYKRLVGARDGAPLVVCVDCGVVHPFVNVRVVPVVAVGVSSRWRCGHHLDVPVTSRGRGCAQCAEDAAARAVRRARVRAERRRVRMERAERRNA